MEGSMHAIYSILDVEHWSRKDYIIQENAWNSSDYTSQRMKLATSKAFFFIQASRSIS